MNLTIKHLDSGDFEVIYPFDMTQLPIIAIDETAINNMGNVGDKGPVPWPLFSIASEDDDEA